LETTICPWTAEVHWSPVTFTAVWYGIEWLNWETVETLGEVVEVGEVVLETAMTMVLAWRMTVVGAFKDWCRLLSMGIFKGIICIGDLKSVQHT